MKLNNKKEIKNDNNNNIKKETRNIEAGPPVLRVRVSLITLV